MYNLPGLADAFPELVKTAWNEMIQDVYTSLEKRWGSKYFKSDPLAVPHGTAVRSVRWSGAPAEPKFCTDLDTAAVLSDWGIQGRHTLHNEYCEYQLIYRADAAGKMRPKRLHATTELREYWLTLAAVSPDSLGKAANAVLGRTPSWEELYGSGIKDPTQLSTEQRRLAFARENAGNGYFQDLIDAGIPAQPTGALNTQNLLFMSHPINGLDDLFYIVMFGAHPYSVGSPGSNRKATITEVFKAPANGSPEYLRCRNADPTAAQGALDQVYGGNTIGFADPLGMYLLSFASNKLFYKNSPVPDKWIRWGRGAENLRQRLEFGPSDEESVFLDDIILSEGASDRPVKTGYDLVALIEVGPVVLVGDAQSVTAADYVTVPEVTAELDCRKAGVCSEVILPFKQAYDRAHATSPKRGRP